MTEIQPIQGLWCALLTPLAPGGGIDLARLADHAQGLLRRGVDGLMPFGTSGEGPSLPLAERRAGLEALLAAGVPPARLLAATGCAAFADAVALTRHALGAGVLRCLALPPFFWKGLSDEAVFRYYAGLIEAVGDPRLRLYLYHIPQVSAVPISPQVVARLADAYPEQVAGVKDSGGDFAHTAELLERAPRLAILTGHEPHLPRLLGLGAAGSIGGVANLFPETVAALLRPGAGPDQEARVQAFLDIAARHPYLPACKAILAEQTGDPAWLAPCPPLLPLADSERAALFADLRAAGFDLAGA
jgi:4-hydroxy-tetrahydrodipicolinate synthase